ncbi:11381_t:CDS:2 [Acaulospora colombiana]|uniref:11381_t:CDS:1 n=1 Tax=Acaulospora colombiana TaxID=27376 RepID=A0ACA9K9U2_9GLOM|nr:11381_t:CDS:2 [Acaulospora colombiana]
MFRQHLLNRADNDPITARTVMISRIPHSLRTEEKLKEFVEKLGLGPVESARMVRHVGKLDRKISRREKVLLALEKAHIQLAKNVCNAITRRRFGVGSWLFGRKNENLSIILESGETREHQRIQSIIEWMGSRKRKRTANNENSSSSGQTKNATISATSTFVNENIMERGDGYGQQFLIWNSLSQLSKNILDKYQPVHRIGFMGSGKIVRSIDHYLKKFNYLDRRIAELRSKPTNATPYKATKEAVLVRYYYFSLFNVFIVFLLGITFLQSIFDVINAPTSIFEILATNLPQGATFFINYVIFNTCTHGLELVQVGSQIFLHIILTSRFVATTPPIIPGAFLVPLLIGTGYFKYYCHKTFYSRTHFLALDTRLDRTNVERNSRIGDNEVQTEKPIDESPKASHKNNSATHQVVNFNSQDALVNTGIIESGMGSIFGRNSTNDGFHRLEATIGAESETSAKCPFHKNEASIVDNEIVQLSTTANSSKAQNSAENLERDQNSLEKDSNNIDVEHASATLRDQESLIADGNTATSPRTSESVSHEKESGISQKKSDDGIASSNVTRPKIKLLIIPQNNTPLVSSPDSLITRSAPRFSSRGNFRDAVRSSLDQDEVSQYQTYTHPNLVKALSRKLWLPLNPYKKICLDDTVELSRALTSSEGGSSLVGYWGEASPYLGEARVSVYGAHEFPNSPFHQRDATGGTIGEHCINKRATSGSIPEVINEGDEGNPPYDCDGPLSPEEEGVVSLNEFVSGELESGELSSGEEF